MIGLTDLTDHELLTWCQSHRTCAGTGPVAQAMIRVLDEREKARRAVDGLTERNVILERILRAREKLAETLGRRDVKAVRGAGQSAELED